VGRTGLKARDGGRVLPMARKSQNPNPSGHLFGYVGPLSGFGSTSAPQPTLVFDRFHVVQHLNRAIDEVRRAEVRRLAHQEGIDLKKTRFILLKNPWNLTPKEHRRLSHLLKLNLPIVRAYYLKEEFQRFWDYLQEKRTQAKPTSNNGSGGPLTLGCNQSSNLHVCSKIISPVCWP